MEARGAKAPVEVAAVEKGVPLVLQVSVARGDAEAEAPPELVAGVVVWEAPVLPAVTAVMAALAMSLSNQLPMRM